ncbi:MAG: GIY-YIG nuclease family protein [Deltaproteobacteria bacterium]|nr:GIY-YIG nuclease family protein [Deltaproteobacteria bacterium]
MTSRNTKYFVYILESSDGRYYTGYTTDLDRRFKEHQAGVGGKFTRSFGADKILHHEFYATQSEALKREAQLKGWTRAKKEALIRGMTEELRHKAIFRQSQRLLRQKSWPRIKKLNPS